MNFFLKLGDSGFWLSVYYGARVIFIILDTILLGGLIFVFQKALPFRPDLRIHGGGGHEKKIPTLRDAVTKERWEAIRKKVASGTLESMKLAIIDADKIVDDVLKRLGLQGTHMADRLEQIRPDELRSLEGLWRAHRLRNELVHTPGFELRPETAERAIQAYETFLKEVKVL